MHLVFANAAHIEVSCIGVRQIKTAHACCGRHGQTAGEVHVYFVALQHSEHVFLCTVIGACGVAWCGANALVFFFDELCVTQRFACGVAPQVGANAVVHALGKGFGQPVGERFKQNGGVVVVGVHETLFLFFRAQACRHRKHAHVVSRLRLIGHKVRQTTIGVVVGFHRLLTQTMPRHELLLTSFIGVNHDVVAHALRGIQADNSVSGEPTVVDNFFQHRLPIGVNLFGFSAHHVVFQDGGEGASQIPRLKKRRPVDVFF